jgi:hypothetical protein
MLRRLTRGWRWQAAWLLSLVYILAVLAPAAANACASRESTPDRVAAASEQSHDHAAHGHDHAGAHVDADSAPAPSHDHDFDKASGLKCCGLACISALPAHDIDVSRPDHPLSVTISFVYQQSAGRSPPRLYRPPIS